MCLLPVTSNISITIERDTNSEVFASLCDTLDSNLSPLRSDLRIDFELDFVVNIRYELDPVLPASGIPFGPTFHSPSFTYESASGLQECVESGMLMPDR